MPKSATQFREEGLSAASSQARVVDIRTGKPWRPPPEPKIRPFLLDLGITFAVVLLGAWLFLKMQGG
jgi:hypothetical protein